MADPAQQPAAAAAAKDNAAAAPAAKAADDDEDKLLDAMMDEHDLDKVYEGAEPGVMMGFGGGFMKGAGKKGKKGKQQKRIIKLK